MMLHYIMHCDSYYHTFDSVPIMLDQAIANCDFCHIQVCTFERVQVHIVGIRNNKLASLAFNYNLLTCS